MTRLSNIHDKIDAAIRELEAIKRHWPLGEGHEGRWMSAAQELINVGQHNCIAPGAFAMREMLERIRTRDEEAMARFRITKP